MKQLVHRTVSTTSDLVLFAGLYVLGQARSR